MVLNSEFIKALMEGDEEVLENTPEENKTSETEILEEIVFPEDMTFRLLDSYQDPLYNREFLGDSYSELMIKLYRSVRRWKIECPAWLKIRVNSILPRNVK